jgi:hypothetical protein
MSLKRCKHGLASYSGVIGTQQEKTVILVRLSHPRLQCWMARKSQSRPRISPDRFIRRLSQADRLELEMSLLLAGTGSSPVANHSAPLAQISDLYCSQVSTPAIQGEGVESVRLTGDMAFARTSRSFDTADQHSATCTKRSSELLSLMPTCDLCSATR